MSHSCSYNAAPLFHISPEKARCFCHEILLANGEMPDLGNSRDENFLKPLVAQAKIAFSNVLDSVEERLQDKSCGIAGIDIPEIFDDVTDDAIAGAFLSVALTTALISPTKDVENLTPFTMFSASYESSSALDAAGLLNISPTDILDFHSDGLVRGQNLGVPRYISIYNTFINYNRPGQFYWIPAMFVENLAEHVDAIGFDDDFYFELTPAIYGRSKSEIGNVVERKVKTAIFKHDDDGTIVTFMNGKFAGKGEDRNAYADQLQAFQKAIATNPFRYTVNQQTRRMVVLNNAAGFHARDIFEDPIPGHEETRNYLRSVSIESIPTGHVL